MTSTLVNGHMMEPAFNSHYQNCSEGWPQAAGQRFLVGSTDIWVGGNTFSGYAKMVRALCPYVAAGRTVRPELPMTPADLEVMAINGIPVEEGATPGTYRAASPLRYVSHYRTVDVPNVKFRH